MKTYY